MSQKIPTESERLLRKRLSALDVQIRINEQLSDRVDGKAASQHRAELQRLLHRRREVLDQLENRPLWRVESPGRVYEGGRLVATFKVHQEAVAVADFYNATLDCQLDRIKEIAGSTGEEKMRGRAESIVRARSERSKATSTEPVVTDRCQPDTASLACAVAYLRDYCHLQEAGLVEPANRYAPADVHEVADAIFESIQTRSEGS